MTELTKISKEPISWKIGKKTIKLQRIGPYHTIARDNWAYEQCRNRMLDLCKELDKTDRLELIKDFQRRGPGAEALQDIILSNEGQMYLIWRTALKYQEEMTFESCQDLLSELNSDEFEFLLGELYGLTPEIGATEEDAESANPPVAAEETPAE